MTTLAEQVIDLLGRLGYTIGTAESLTGGLVCAALVDVPGASRVVRGGIVAYDPAVKIDALGVDADLIAAQGTVNVQVAREMALGARTALACDVAVSTTGVAGPGAAEGLEPGTVVIAVATANGAHVQEHRFSGDRAQIRHKSVDAALSVLAVTLEEQARDEDR